MKRWSEYFSYREDSENNYFSRHIYFPSIQWTTFQWTSLPMNNPPLIPKTTRVCHFMTQAKHSGHPKWTLLHHPTLVMSWKIIPHIHNYISLTLSSQVLYRSFLFSYIHCQTYFSSIWDPKRDQVHCARRHTQSPVQASSSVNRPGKPTLKGKTEVQLHKKYLSLVSCYQG